MMLKARAEFERSLKASMPEFKRFSARVSKLSMDDLPCVNIYFHRDSLIEKKNFYDDRETVFVIEACIVPSGDAEAELVLLLERIRTAIEQNDGFQTVVADCVLNDIDIAHEMIGEKRIAALSMTWHVPYQKPHWQAALSSVPNEIWINGEKQNA